MGATRYLLDTNIRSSLLKLPDGPVAGSIRAAGEDSVCTSVVVACELRYGAAKKGSPLLAERVEQRLAALEMLPLGVGADEHCGEIRFELESEGKTIGANDYLLAAHALSAGLTLVTDNVDEFSRVPGLRVENWLRPS